MKGIIDGINGLLDEIKRNPIPTIFSKAANRVIMINSIKELFDQYFTDMKKLEELAKFPKFLLGQLKDERDAMEEHHKTLEKYMC